MFGGRSGRVPGIAPRHPPTPPDVRVPRIRRLDRPECFRPSHAAKRTPEHSAGLGAFCVGPCVGQSRVATVVVTPCCFVRFHVRLSSVLVGSVRSFGPSLGTPFRSCVPPSLLWPLLTAPGLSAGGSPRVRVCSFRSGLWALQDAVSDCRASRVLACSPPTSCLTAHLCSFGRTFACHPFAPPPCGDDLAVRLRLASPPPSGTFQPDRPNPCRAHERGVHAASRPAYIERSKFTTVSLQSVIEAA